MGRPSRSTAVACAAQRQRRRGRRGLSRRPIGSETEGVEIVPQGRIGAWLPSGAGVSPACVGRLARVGVRGRDARRRSRDGCATRVYRRLLAPRQRKLPLLRAFRRGLPVNRAVHYAAHLLKPPLRALFSLLAAPAAVRFGRGCQSHFHLLFVHIFNHLPASLPGGVGQKPSNPKDFLSFVLRRFWGKTPP